MLIKQKRQAAAPLAARSSGMTVGSEIQTSCTKCKSVTTHVVIAKVGLVPTSVQCKACSSLHAYRRSRPPVAKGTPIDKRSVDVIWQEAMKRARGAAVPYVSSGYYEVGARLRHLSFGEGVVSRLSSTTVCEVIFATGTVRLLMGGGTRAS
jgi:hypothetical protein